MELRKDIQFFRYEDGTYQMYDQRYGRHFHIGAEQRDWLLLFDGTRSYEDIRRAIPQEYFDVFMQYIEKYELLDDSNLSDRHVDRYRIKFRLCNPEVFLERAGKLCAVYATVLKLIFWPVLVACVVLLVKDMGFLLQSSATNLYSYSVSSIVLIYILVFITGILHELSHASVARACNVAVPEMGFMLFYFNPAFYVNLSGINMIEDKSRKIEILSAGIKLNVLFMFISLVCIEFLQGSGNSLAIELLSIYTLLNLTVVMVNLIPFIEFDGYYIWGVVEGKTDLKACAAESCRQFFRGDFYRVDSAHLVFFVFSFLFSTSFLLLAILGILWAVSTYVLPIPSLAFSLVGILVIVMNVRRYGRMVAS